MWDSEKYLLIGLMCFVACVLILSAFYVKVNVQASQSCLEHGWPEHKIALITMEPYCIRRVNQTDTVVALRLLK